MADGGDQQSRPDSVGLDSLSSRQRDLIDLANETAGRETGRAQRFHTGDNGTLDAKREREKERAFNELLRRLQDPEYAKLYHKVKDAVTRVGNVVDAALRENALEADDAARRLREMRDSAATLADGRKVFRGQNGRLIAEDGSDVSDQRASITGLSDATPLYDEYAREKERAEALAREREQIERYRREKLDPVKERLDDPNNPYEKDELQEIFGTLREDMPERVKKHEQEASPPSVRALPSESAADEYMGSYELNAPDVNARFTAARDGAAPAQPGATPQPDPTPKVV